MKPHVYYARLGRGRSTKEQNDSFLSRALQRKSWKYNKPLFWKQWKQFLSGAYADRIFLLHLPVYRYFFESWFGIPSNMKSMKRHPSKNFYHRTFCVSFANTVFWTSRFSLKNTAIEVTFILRMIFLNMFLDIDFTNSTEDEILSKIHTK